MKEEPRKSIDRSMSAQRLLLPLLICGLLPLLAACELLPKLMANTPSLYVLTPKSNFRADLPTVSWQLVVEEPLAAGGINAARIARRSRPTELNYFANANWTERAPRMVQTLLVESFENSERIVAVGRQAISLRSDFDLKSELREFQAHYAGDSTLPEVVVRLNVKLIEQPQRAIIGSKTFAARVPTVETGMPAIIQSFDAALGKVLRRTVEWTLLTAEARVQERGSR